MYTFTPAPGAYRVDVRHPAFQPATTGARLVDRDAGCDVALTRISIEQHPPVTVMPVAQPRLHLRITGRMPLGQARPLPGAWVTLTQGLAQIERGQADTQGIFSSRPLAPGTYGVAVTQQGFQAAVLNITLAQVDVQRDVTLNPESAFIPEPGPAQPTLRLRVLGRDARGQVRPVPEADISIGRNRMRVAGGKASPAGLYAVRLQPGAYVVDVTHPAFAPGRIEVTMGNQDLEREIALTVGTQPLLIIPAQIIPIQQNLRLTIVERPGGPPVPGAQIAITRQGNPVASGVSDAQGAYGVSLAAGTYRIGVTRLPTHVPTSLDVAVGAAPVTREIVLQRVRIE
jgi:hypothetical protein